MRSWHGYWVLVGCWDVGVFKFNISYIVERRDLGGSVVEGGSFRINGEWDYSRLV